MKYEQLNDQQLGSLRDYVTQDMPAGLREKQLMWLVLEQARRANALAEAAQELRGNFDALDAALAAYLGEGE